MEDSGKDIPSRQERQIQFVNERSNYLGSTRRRFVPDRFLEVAEFNQSYTNIQREYYGFNPTNKKPSFEVMANAIFIPFRDKWLLRSVNKVGERHENVVVFFEYDSSIDNPSVVRTQITMNLPGKERQGGDSESISVIYDRQNLVGIRYDDYVSQDKNLAATLLTIGDSPIISDLIKNPYGGSDGKFSKIEDIQAVLEGTSREFQFFHRSYILRFEGNQETNQGFIIMEGKDGNTEGIPSMTFKIPLRIDTNLAYDLFPAEELNNPYDAGPQADRWLTTDNKSLLGGFNWEESVPKVSSQDSELPSVD